MRVAVIIDTWFPFVGGGQINAWEISKRVASKDVKVDIITRNSGADNLKPPKNLRIIKVPPSYKVAPFDTLFKIIFLIRALILILREDYDLVHVHAFLPGITSRLLMIFKGIPTLFTVHGTSIGTNLLNPLARHIEKFILTEILYTVQITVSKDFLKFKNINKKIIYIPNGVDIKKFDKVKIRKFKYPTLIFVGRLHPQKNLDTLIRSIGKISESFPNVRLEIVGNGPQKLKLIELVKSLRLSKNIKFHGEITGGALIRRYKSSHIFVLPSIYEGQPLTLLEAWASKLPVIVTKTGDCQFLVKNGVNGFLINNPREDDEIASLITRTLESRNLEKLGSNGYNLVAKNFSWEKSAQETKKVYENLAKSQN